MENRNISISVAENILNNPQQIIKERQEKVIYQPIVKENKVDFFLYKNIYSN